MNNKNKFSLLLVITLLVTGLLSSCFKDDLTDCPRPFQVTIKALDANLEDFTDEQLSSLSMALLLANVHFDTLSDLPKTTGLRQLFLLNCAHLPTSIVFEWLQQEEKDDLAAACMSH